MLARSSNCFITQCQLCFMGNIFYNKKCLEFCHQACRDTHNRHVFVFYSMSQLSCYTYHQWLMWIFFLETNSESTKCTATEIKQKLQKPPNLNSMGHISSVVRKGIQYILTIVLTVIVLHHFITLRLDLLRATVCPYLSCTWSFTWANFCIICCTSAMQKRRFYLSVA